MFRGDFTKVLLTIAFLFASFACFGSYAQLADVTDDRARQLLAQKVLRVGQDMELKEGSFKESLSGGGKETNANDKNSFMSSTTYHSYVWDYCLKWAGGRQCDEWLPSYVSLHGAHGDRSPLEGEVYNAWSQNRKKANQQGGGGDYAIWNVKAEGGSPFKYDGTLDRERLTEWRIKDQVRNKLEKIGKDTANRTVGKTFEKNEQKDAMPNQESLRMMAARWTKMFRNRMLSNIGEVRAMQPGIEMALGEDIPDCNQYLNELRQNQDRTKMEDRIDPQNLLAIETRTKQIQQRLKSCQQARAMNAYAANVQAKQGEPKSAGPKGEWIDAALSRANLAAIDSVGTDPLEVGIDERIQVQENDLKSKITVWENGGKGERLVMMSNADQLKSYNRQLASADAGFEAAAARNPFLKKSQKSNASRFAIQKGSINAVKLNDMTPDMMQEIKKGGYPGSTGNDHPGDRLETTPSELVVQKK